MAPPRLGFSPATTELSSRRDDPVLALLLDFHSPSASVVAAPVPRGCNAISWIVASLFAAIVLATGLISIDQEVTARGEVVSKAPTLVVQPLDTAIVHAIEVHVGEKVRAGQVLARLDPTFAAADLGAFAAEVASLEAMAARLTTEATGKPFARAGSNQYLALQAAIHSERQAEYDYRLRGYQDTIDALTNEIASAESDASEYRQRLALAADVEKMRRQLQALQAGSKLETLGAIDTMTEMQGNYLAAVQAAAGARRRLAAEVAARDGFVQSWHEDASQKLAETLSKLADARQQLRKAELRSRLVALRADRDATVLTVAKVSPGSVVQSGQKLFTLVPADAPLEVEANIPGSEAGYVRPGNTVAIKFATFPFTRYGLAYGTLRLLSANSFTAEDMQQNQESGVPLPPGETAPYYRARIAIDRIDLHGTPPGFHLVPGMPVEADVKVGRHTVLQYFLQRILPIAHDAMHEPG